MNKIKRYTSGKINNHLKTPITKIQPILAKKGKATIDLIKLAEYIDGYAQLEPLIVVESPESWTKSVRELSEDIDVILPLSIPAYPTEVWNSHPQPLIERKIPLIFWPLIEYNEPDFWRWSASDFLKALGVEIYIAKNMQHGEQLLRSFAVKRMLTNSKIIVFGKQNFPWNAHAAGHLIKNSMGTEIVVKPLSDIRSLYNSFTETQINKAWEEKKNRYTINSVKSDQLKEAIKVYLSIKTILKEENAAAFGLNCFGDLVISGDRDVPCLAQSFLREDGFVTACDGDFIALMSMMMITYLLDKPCMMSNMYPVQYIGALKDHFGDPLSPNSKKYPKNNWKNLARLAHCGFVGIISPEMTHSGKVVLNDWGGTYEIKRNGQGCGIDAALIKNQKVTVVELCFDGKTLLLADAEICETTRHPNMPHCESSVLMKFRDLEGFVENISREHVAIVYGSHIEDFKVLAEILNLNCKIF